MRVRANAVVGGTLIGLLAAVSLTAGFWTPYEPLRINLRARLRPPSDLFWLGTDEFGRDVVSRLMAGAATSAMVALLTVVAAVVLGVVIGVLAGFLRGWLDRVLMAVNDTLLAFPGILLALGLMAVIGPNKWGIILALGLAHASARIQLRLHSFGRAFLQAANLLVGLRLGNVAQLAVLLHPIANRVALAEPLNERRDRRRFDSSHGQPLLNFSCADCHAIDSLNSLATEGSAARQIVINRRP